MILRLRSLLSRTECVYLLLFLGALSITSTAFAYTIRRPQSDLWYPSTPLTSVPGRQTPAAAETTIRHQIFFTDFEAGAPGWTTMNWRAGMPVGWNIVSGSHACTGNSWWCGQTGLPFGDGYGNDWIQTLTTNVPINIAGFSSTQLTFKMRHQSEFTWDWGWVLIKSGAAGARWDTLASYSGDWGGACVNRTLPIPASYNSAVQPITLQFLFGSDTAGSAADSTGTFTGWTVDDVAVKSGTTTHFFDDMESGPSNWLSVSPNPGLFWHVENNPGTSQPATCIFLSTNVWTPFQGVGFGVIPDYADQMVMSPPMDISGVFSAATPTTTLTMQFDQWINMPPDNSVFWSLWIQGSNDKVTWTPWKNAHGGAEQSGSNTPQCTEALTTTFNPYDFGRTGIVAGTKYIRLALRIRDEKAIDGCLCDKGPLRLGFTTEGMYFDNFGVYYVYTISGVETVSGVPAASRPMIRKAFPNPFNPMTTIEFSVPVPGPVRVGVFDIHGKHVATLVNDAMNSGVFRVRWYGKDAHGADVASGVYYAQIQSRGRSDSGRLALIK